MQQLRLSTVHSRDLGNPFSRWLATAVGMLVVMTCLALFLCIVVPILGVSLSAAVGGVILALTGIMLMVPMLVVAGTVAGIWTRGRSRHVRS